MIQVVFMIIHEHLSYHLFGSLTHVGIVADLGGWMLFWHVSVRTHRLETIQDLQAILDKAVQNIFFLLKVPTTTVEPHLLKLIRFLKFLTYNLGGFGPSLPQDFLDYGAAQTC